MEPTTKRLIVPFVLLMAIGTVALVLAASAQARSHAAGVWQEGLRWTGLAQETAEPGALYWCPMHPQIKRTRPNEVCPICNMALVKVEGGAKDQSPEHLTVTPRQIQQAGVVTEPVLRRELYREIDTTGRVDYDERRLAKITSWIRGKSRIVKLHVSFTGETVDEGAPLADLYSPALITAQEEFLLALESSARDSAAPRPNSRLSSVLGRGVLLEAARQKLIYQGLSAEQVDDLASSRNVLDHVTIHAPQSGTVIERAVQEGQYVDEGELLLAVADLSRLWLFADIYEDELPTVQIGQTAQIAVRSLPAESFEGKVAFIEPVVQPQTRTVRVRIDVENRQNRLKPGMYARVVLHNRLPEMLAVPTNAVLWSGQRRVVLVRQSEGAVQPREVRLGETWLYPVQVEKRKERLDFAADRVRYHQVLAGLQPGDQVVTAGAFLLNAESQFQSVLTKMLPPASESATLEEVLGDEVARRLRSVLDAYYKLSQVLAQDQLQNVAQRAGALADEAAALAGQAEQEKLDKLAAQAGRLAERARELASGSPGDLRQARAGFGRISRELIELLSRHGGRTLHEKELFLFECGMSKVGYEKWVWWSPEIHNPYMGQKMLDCGRQLETFEP